MSLTWVDDLPADAPSPVNRGKHGGKHIFQSFFDDPRFDKDWEEDERLCAETIPIPFFPDDLPTLKTAEFGWTQDELQSAAARARAILFSSKPPKP